MRHEPDVLMCLAKLDEPTFDAFRRHLHERRQKTLSNLVLSRNDMNTHRFQGAVETLDVLLEEIAQAKTVLNRPQ